MHVLSIGSVFAGVLLPIGGVDGGPFNLEYFIFGSCFLNACPSNLFEVGLIVVQEVPECHFEFLIELHLLILYR